MTNQPIIVDEFGDEEFIIPVPEDAEEGDELVFPILSEEEAEALCSAFLWE